MASYDWIIGISVAIMIAIYFWSSDDNHSGLLIIVFLNIGFTVMVYAGLIQTWILILNVLFTILILYLSMKSRGTN